MESGTVTEIAHLSAEGVGRTVDAPDGSMVVFFPPDWQSKVLPPIDPVLTHIKQTVTFQDQASFSTYIAEHLNEDSRLFVDIERAVMTVVFDYHKAAGAEPARMAHRAVYGMKLSDEWKRWTGIDGTKMPQMSFARFLEENVQDIVDPAGADVLELSLNLQAKKKVHFEAGVRLQTGSNQITFKEEIEANGGRKNLAVMPDFEIGIPVFFNGEPYRVKCFLRYDIDDGKLSFKVDMNRRAHIHQHAVQESAKAVAAEHSLTPLFATLPDAGRF